MTQSHKQVKINSIKNKERVFVTDKEQTRSSMIRFREVVKNVNTIFADSKRTLGHVDLLQKELDTLSDINEKYLEGVVRKEYNDITKQLSTTLFEKISDDINIKKDKLYNNNVNFSTTDDAVVCWLSIKKDKKRLSSMNKKLFDDDTKKECALFISALTDMQNNIRRAVSENEKMQDVELMSHLINKTLPEDECLKRYEFLHKRKMKTIECGMNTCVSDGTTESFYFFGERCALIEESLFRATKRKAQNFNRVLTDYTIPN